MDLIKNEKYLITAGLDQKIKVYDVEQRKLIRTLGETCGSLYALKTLEEGIICFGGSDRSKMYAVDVGDLSIKNDFYKKIQQFKKNFFK